MALTFGSGPFARPTAGRLNGDLWSFLPAHAVYTHSVDKRLRANVAGTSVLDTTSAVLLHETGLPPVYYVPLADIAPGVLEPSPTVTTCPFKGTARYCHFRIGDQMIPDSVWAYPEPIVGMEQLADLVSIRWDAVDEWWEENHRLDGRPRDPFHRVDCLPSSRSVVIKVGDTELGRSDRAIAVFETGLPARFYVPAEDVLVELTPTQTRTHCPYKGECNYVAAVGIDDVGWVYAQPYDESRAIAGAYCFDPSKVTTELAPLP